MSLRGALPGSSTGSSPQLTSFTGSRSLKISGPLPLHMARRMLVTANQRLTQSQPDTSPNCSVPLTMARSTPMASAWSDTTRKSSGAPICTRASV